MNTDRELWYSKPAKTWNEALPIGNGRLGAMVSGQVLKETLFLNEESIWSGSRRTRHNPDAGKYIDKVKDLLKEGKVCEAERLAKYSLCSNPRSMSAYQPLGDMYLSFHHQSNDSIYSLNQNLSSYRRSLSLSRAIAEVSYSLGEYDYKREIFSSAVDDVIVVNIKAPKGGMLKVDLELARRPFEMTNCKISDDMIMISGKCSPDGIEYCAIARPIAPNGNIKTIGQNLIVENADDCTFLLAAYTDYQYKDPKSKCLEALEKASKKTFAQLKEDHIKDYQSFYDRLELNLENNNDLSNLPTDERLDTFRQGNNDSGLVELLFDYGRYLLISSSRKCSMPANLQGIWNNQMTPAWESKYTININTQMNYWQAEVCNLADCHRPLFEFLEKAEKSGRETAKLLYGCQGFCIHNNLDIWLDTCGVTDAPIVNCWSAGGAWLSLHLWEHYRFTLDKEFLRNKAMPIIKSACLFYLDFLEYDKDGFLVTPISTSPENSYILPDGNVAALCRGAAMDMQIINELFAAAIEMLDIFETDEKLKNLLIQTKQKLKQTQIASDGGIMEWDQDYKQFEPQHRHISHLFGLYPGTQIDTEKTPQLAEAAEISLNNRLKASGGHTGWAAAWISCCFARLHKSDKAYENLSALFKSSSMMSNMLCIFEFLESKLVFQIDANFGSVAAVAEMLLQSHNDFIEILPALPQQWHSGSIKGLIARGGFKVDISWKDGKLVEAVVSSQKGGTFKARYKSITTQNIKLDKGGSINLSEDYFNI